jgi:hypothetical protein
MVPKEGATLTVTAYPGAAWPYAQDRDTVSYIGSHQPTKLLPLLYLLQKRWNSCVSDLACISIRNIADRAEVSGPVRW